MPQDCVRTMAERCAEAKKRAPEEFSAALDYYMNGDADRPRARALLDALAEASGLDARQSDMAVILTAFTLLEEKYARLGLPKQMYRNACRDVRCKLLECKALYGVWGTFVSGWYLRFFVPSRFAMGRFHFETSELKAPGIEKVVFDDLPGVGHQEVLEGDTIIRIHIPSTGEPITDDVRMDAYKQAYAFYRGRYPGRLVPFSCKSWLLYDKNPELLREDSNILKFMRDFCILPGPYSDVYGDLWRIFHLPNDTPFALLPENTSLQRAYKKHLLSGGTPGECEGLFLFDGKRIFNRPAEIVTDAQEPER